MKKLLFLIVTGCFVLAIHAQEEDHKNIFIPIKRSFPEKVGMDTAVLRKLTADIASGYYPNIHSLLIYKDDNLVYEGYFPGKDQLWGKDLGVISHYATDLHDVRSISKSVVAACIGIAIAQKKIRSVDEKVFTWFREYSQYDTGAKRDLTIRHLLNMSSGLEWNEDVPYDDPSNSEILMTNSSDPIGFILSRNLVQKPGEVWNYNGGTTQLLATLLERATGKPIDVFAKDHLFKPLGITKFEWVKFPGWNRPAAASGLRLRSIDLLKFGVLLYNNGRWNQKQIVPAEWIEQTFSSIVNTPRAGWKYGYHFWISTDKFESKPVTISAAVGNGDQRIYMDRKNKLIVVITAGNYNLWDIQNNSYTLLKAIYTSFRVRD